MTASNLPESAAPQSPPMKRARPPTAASPRRQSAAPAAAPPPAPPPPASPLPRRAQIRLSRPAPYRRNPLARACPGHPRLRVPLIEPSQDVGGRNKSGHGGLEP